MAGHAPQHDLVPLTFELGKIFITREAIEYIGHAEALKGLCRHLSEGCVDDIDLIRLENTNILSIYTAPNGLKYWIITEADRSATTVFIPDEDEQQ